ncbi:MAG: oligosaccharide flippase family protein [Chloroflexi bacterium]|nr:oligosaccharide flippase family protein [Chloroflexota bacterium]
MKIPTLLQKGPVGQLLTNPLMQRVIRNSGYLFTGSTLSAAMSMAQGIMAARLLGVQAFGVLGIITVFASVINRLTSFRMSELVVNYVGEYSAKEDWRGAAAAFKGAAMAEAASSLIAYALIVGLAPLGARTLAQDAGLADLFAVYGLMVIGHLVAESSTGLLQYFDRFRTLAAIQIGQSALTLALIGYAFLNNGGLEAIVIAYLLGKSISGVSVGLAALRQARQAWGPGWWRTPLSRIADRRRSMLRFGVNTSLTGTLTLLTRDSELLWLGALASPLQAGYYKVTLAILNVLIIPVQPLISTTYREVSREIASRRWENVRYLLRSGSLIAGAYSMVTALGLVVIGRWVVSLWGTEFLPVAQQSLMILLLGITVVNTFYWDRTVLLPLGQPEYPTKVTFVAAVLKVGAIFLLVPTFGAIGMAITLGGFFLATRSILVWKTLREIRLRAKAAPVPETTS